jgi:Ras-related protein Rab-8A
MADAYDHKEKFLLVGRPGSGKSSIVTKFSEDVFRSEYISTIGVDFNMRTVIIDGKPIQLQIWDTGDERLRSIIQAYYRGTAAIMIVFDVTNEKSYSDLSKWMDQVKQFGSDKVEVLLVANKCDLEGERCVTEQQCQKFAIQYDLDVMYVSAKTGENIHEAFETLAQRVLSRREQDDPPS